jgi:hypothetical protein
MTVWADGFGVWHARVRRDAGAIIVARKALRDELEQRESNVARNVWMHPVRVVELDTADTIVYKEGEAEVKHWHIATGLAGYGPDAADHGYDTATDMRHLADSIAEELKHFADFNDQGARSEAEAEDYKEAWQTMMLAEELSILAMNLDYDKRLQAPLYVNDAAALDASIERIVSEQFPLDVSYNTRLYVWQCDEAECEHTDESEAE